MQKCHFLYFVSELLAASMYSSMKKLLSVQLLERREAFCSRKPLAVNQYGPVSGAGLS